jgi:hypothetical protein
MPITDFSFENQIFFAKETGVVSETDAKIWVEQLADCARFSRAPIVALVDALEVSRMVYQAYVIFSKATFIPNVIEVVVATNSSMNLSSQNVGLLGKHNHTSIFPTLDQAKRHATKLLQAQQGKK